MGAVGAAWPSSRGSGAGERAAAASNATDRRWRRGLPWERRGGEPLMSATRRRAAGRVDAGLGRRRLVNGAGIALAGGHWRGEYMGVTNNAAGASLSCVSAVGADASRLRAAAVRRTWQLSGPSSCDGLESKIAFLRGPFEGLPLPRAGYAFWKRSAMVVDYAAADGERHQAARAA